MKKDICYSKTFDGVDIFAGALTVLLLMEKYIWSFWLSSRLFLISYRQRTYFYTPQPYIMGQLQILKCVVALRLPRERILIGSQAEFPLKMSKREGIICGTVGAALLLA